ncbi:hypothetical protein J6590_064414 [Homalodisca vitripennis]|nr:hypothetical protein J6590_064414 [Homalodisca vitripennis]
MNTNMTPDIFRTEVSGVKSETASDPRRCTKGKRSFTIPPSGNITIKRVIESGIGLETILEVRDCTLFPPPSLPGASKPRYPSPPSPLLHNQDLPQALVRALY